MNATMTMGPLLVSLILPLLTGCQTSQNATSVTNYIRSNNTAEALARIQQCKDLDRTDARGDTPLDCAAEHGDLEITKALVEKGAKVHKEGRPLKQFPLMCAAIRPSNAAVIGYLLEHGAAVNQTK